MSSTSRGTATPSSQGPLTIRRAEGASSSSSSSSSLGVYGPSHSTLRQKVLSEEAYTSTLSRLIRRDFYPHLEKLEAENAYLDALTTLDEPDGEARLERAVRRLVGHEVRTGLVPPSPRPSHSGKRTRHETPIDDTPVRSKTQWDPTPIASTSHEDEDDPDNGDGGLQPREEQAPSLDGLTLSSFQAAYTSEDNASFLQLLEAGQKRKKEAFRWAYEAEAKANERRKRALQAANLEAQAGARAALENAPPDVRKRLEARQERKLITAHGNDAEHEQAVAVTSRGELDKTAPERAEDGAQAAPLWPHKARNALFYGPDADRSTLHSRTSSLVLTRHSDSSANAPPSHYDGDHEHVTAALHRVPGINFANTRLYDGNDAADDGRTTGSETPRSSRIDAAIGGRLSAAPSSDDGMSQHEDRDDTARENYDFVSPLPSPRPGDLGEERVRQLMTWGTIMGTPRAVRQNEAADDDNGTAAVQDGSFRLPPTPRRDTLGRQLADKAGSSRRKGTLHASRAVAAAASSSKRSRADLSPAARTLLDRTTRRTTLGDALLGAKIDEERSANRLRRQRWTPSPSPQRRAD